MALAPLLFVRPREISTDGLIAALLSIACLLHPATAVAGKVLLTNDDELSGVVTERDETGLTLEHQDLGTLRLEAANIQDVTLKKSDPAYVKPTVPDFFWGWDKTVSAGLNGSDGNTETLSLYARFETGYEDENDRWAFDASVFYAENDGEETQNEFQISLTKDWLFEGEPMFYWVNTKYENDRFTGFKERTSGFAGIGYDFVQDQDYTLIGRLGVGGQYEAGRVNEFTPEMLISLEGKWQINDASSLRYYTFLYPSLDPAFSEFRNVSGLAYKVSVDKANGLSLKAGVENEYQSEVAVGTEKNDLKYFAALVLDF